MKQLRRNIQRSLDPKGHIKAWPGGLKPDRQIWAEGLEFFCNETLPRGTVVSAPNGTCVKEHEAGEHPVGILMHDVVNLDLTRQHINFHRDEVQQGGKVNICRGGILCIRTNEPVRVGDSAMSNGHRIGTFLSGRDADGYTKVRIEL